MKHIIDMDIEAYFDARQDEYEVTHPVCLKCGAYMVPQIENYGLNGPYEDKWFECPCCGYCLDR